MTSYRPGVLALGITDPISAKLLTGLPAFLERRGWEVDLVVGGPLDPVEGATVHMVPMCRNPSPLADLRSLVGWIRLLHSRRPHVVLAGTPKAGLLGMVAGWICRVPVRIYHLRGLRLETSGRKSALVLTLLERLAMACSTSVLAVSPSLRDECVRRGLAPAAKIVVLGSGSSNGVDLGRFRQMSPSSKVARRSELELDPDLPVVGYVGRLTPAKGIDDLVEAVLAMGAQRCQLLLVGSEEVPGYAETVTERLRRGGVRATHLPWAEDVVGLYAVMEVLCLPSHREGFPNVVLEASACGVPVVTTDATGCRDSVVPGRTGWIARTGDTADLARWLAVALDNPRRRADVAAEARAWVSSHFSRERVQTALAEYLSSAAGTQGAEPPGREISA